MRVVVVLLRVGHYDGRKIAEHIEDVKYNSLIEVKNAILKECDDEDYVKRTTFLDLSDFMDECNNEGLDLHSVWVSYIILNSTENIY